MDLVELSASPQGGNTHPWELSRAQFIETQIRNLAPQLPEKAVVLDFGCGDAFVASLLAQRFPQYEWRAYDAFFTGEVLTRLQAHYASQTNLKIGSHPDELLDGDQAVHLITMLDVIEHIPDEVAAVKEILKHPKMSDEVKVMITVPAFGSLYSLHDVYMKHFRRYNLKQLQETVQRCGLRPERMHYFFFSLLLPRWLSLKQSKTQYHPPAAVSDAVFPESEVKGVAGWNKGPAVTWLVKFVLSLDWRFSVLLYRLGIRIPGLSLYCLCRRNA